MVVTKKSPSIPEELEYVGESEIFANLSYSHGQELELAPCDNRLLRLQRASPSAFLDKRCKKNCRKDRGAGLKIKNNF